MRRLFLALACSSLFTTAVAAGPMDGKWLGRGTVSETPFKIWLDITEVEGAPKLTLDFIIGQGMVRIGDEREPSYSNGKILWKVEANKFGTFLCEATRKDQSTASALCKSDDQELALELTRFEGNPWFSSSLETVAEDDKQRRFVAVVEAVAKAMAFDDFDKFDSYFVDNPKGTLPKALFRRGLFVTMKFGQIQKIEFHEFDEPGAFVTVHFAEDKRDFYVHLDETGKIIELTYVPQPDPHFQ